MIEKFSLLDYEHIFEEGRESYKFAEVMKAVRAIDEPFDASRLVMWIVAEILKNQHALIGKRPQKKQEIKRMTGRGIEWNERQLYNTIKRLCEQVEALELLEEAAACEAKEKAATCEDDDSRN